MKKLLFIIPMVASTKLFIFLFLCCASGNLKAQTAGCHVSYAVSDRLYYTPYFSAGPNAWITTGTVDASGATGGYRQNGSGTYGCIANTGSVCEVYQQYLLNDGVTVGLRIYRTGVSAAIDPTNCPLDDYIHALLIFTLLTTFFKLKKVNALKLKQ